MDQTRTGRAIAGPTSAMPGDDDQPRGDAALFSRARALHKSSAAHRRSQRLSVGAAREGRPRPRQARHRQAAADDHDGHPATARGRRRRRSSGRSRCPARYRPTAVTATLEQIDIVHRMMRKYPETFELARPADEVERIQERQDRVAHRHGGRPLDRQLPRRAAHVSPARRPLHDADAQRERCLGRLGHRKGARSTASRSSASRSSGR